MKIDFKAIFERIISKLFLKRIRTSLFYSVSDLVQSGTYLCNGSKKCFCLDKGESVLFATNVLYQSFTTTKYEVKNKNHSTDLPSIVLFSNSQNYLNPICIKFFNLNNNTITTKYLNKKDFKSYIKIKDDARQYYPLPATIKIDDTRCTLIEELLHGIDIKNGNEINHLKVFSRVLDFYINYYKHATVTTKPYDDLLLDYKFIFDEKTNDFIKNFLHNKSYPCTKQHGDLTSYNIIYNEEKNQLYFIDFEHLGEYFFLYDIFWYIKNYSTQDKNDVLIRYIKEGYFDHKFRLLYKTLNLEYNKELFLAHSLFFVILVYKNRFSKLNDNIALNVAHQFIQIFKKMM